MRLIHSQECGDSADFAYAASRSRLLALPARTKQKNTSHGVVPRALLHPKQAATSFSIERLPPCESGWR